MATPGRSWTARVCLALPRLNLAKFREFISRCKLAPAKFFPPPPHGLMEDDDLEARPSDQTPGEWRQAREQAHSDIMAEVAALGRGPASATAGGGSARGDEDAGQDAASAEQGPDQASGAPAAGPAALGADHGEGEARDTGGTAGPSAAETWSVRAESLHEAAAAEEHDAPAPPAAAPRNAVLRSRASHMRTWCAKLGTAVAVQGAVQFLTGRVCFEEVALWRMQTASCAWHSGSWDDTEVDAREIESHSTVAPSSDRFQRVPSSPHRAARALRLLTSALGSSWTFATPDAETIEARRDWSRDLQDDTFEIVAANSFIWNRALRPIIGIGMAQLLCAHCPKQLWAKMLLVAVPILRHPLKVVSMRLVCPGWPPPSFWQLILYTMDGSARMSPMAGILPKICSHLLVDQLRGLHLDEKLRAYFLRVVESVRARTVRVTAETAEAEQAPRQDPPQAADNDRREQEGRRADRGVQGGEARGRERRLVWAMCEPLQRVLAAMIEDLMLATVSYPLVVLERRMCVDVSLRRVQCSSNDVCVFVWATCPWECLHADHVVPCFHEFTVECAVQRALAPRQSALHLQAHTA